MENTTNSPLHKRQGKDKDFRPQMKIVFEAFSERPKTMLMVEIETGIMRSNITWYVDEWRKQNRIAEIKKGICPISRHTEVGYFSTDQKLFPTSNQLNLFD